MAQRENVCPFYKWDQDKIHWKSVDQRVLRTFSQVVQLNIITKIRRVF
jgi:hypothetical protein